MNRVNILNPNSFIEKMLCTILAISFSIALPQIFHMAGVLLGVDAALGAMLLPMHIPVIAAGFLFGFPIGMLVGFLSPVISYAISGMPDSSMLLYISIELAAYGLCAGLISKTKLNSIGKLIVVQFFGRVLRISAVAVSVYLIKGNSVPFSSILMFIPHGIFGIILQWAFIPFAVNKLEGLKNHYA